MDASRADGEYPRPQLVRPQWRSLDGSWGFAHDDRDRGIAQRWFGVQPAAARRFGRAIEVPFPPESPASGVHETGFHRVVWYRRTLTAADFPPRSTDTDRHLVHFGAVDHEARIWLDGSLVGEHIGGQTPFEIDVTELMSARDGDHVLVVRAADDPRDRSLPRGKQDWRRTPHGIWYHRTTGLWQSVWTETVPELRIADISWTPDITTGSVRCALTLSSRPKKPVAVDVTVSVDGEEVGRAAITMRKARGSLELEIFEPGSDAADDLLWSPERPVLLDAQVVLRAAPGDQRILDEVDSYLGMRSAGVGGGRFLLNGEPYYVKSVLDQGYREDTHLASTGTEQLRAEVEAILALGFNAVRVHQKAEDPRKLYWADRLGLLVWAEIANAHEFSSRAVQLLTAEWLELVRRDRSHPCIVTWVPMNESWGVDDIATEPDQQAYSRALADLTRALDPSIPVMSNEGWEHLDSDILGVHDYADTAEVLLARYGDADAVRRTMASPGPAKRTIMLATEQQERFERGEAPLMITEFGGVSFAGGARSWGYSTATSTADFAKRLGRLFDALRACEPVAGFCYTQLMDTRQETNGLLTSAVRPKLPLATLRRIVTGTDE